MEMLADEFGFTPKERQKIHNKIKYWDSLKKKPRRQKPKNYHHGHWCIDCCIREGYDHPNPIMFFTKYGMIGRWYCQSKCRYRLLLKLMRKYGMDQGGNQ
jgi:hypothetical protein